MTIQFKMPCRWNIQERQLQDNFQNLYIWIMCVLVQLWNGLECITPQASTNVAVPLATPYSKGVRVKEIVPPKCSGGSSVDKTTTRVASDCSLTSVNLQPANDYCSCHEEIEWAANDLAGKGGVVCKLGERKWFKRHIRDLQLHCEYSRIVKAISSERSALGMASMSMNLKWFLYLFIGHVIHLEINLKTNYFIWSW